MIKLSRSTVDFVRRQLYETNAPDYAAAYAAVIADVKGQYPDTSVLSEQDHDSVAWLQTALSVNSGEKSLTAIYIRAVNQAAVADQHGQIIDLFGPEEQAASNAIAKTALKGVVAISAIPSTNDLFNLEDTLVESRADGKRAMRARALDVLRAPVAGVAQGLAIHTIGGVVTPSQPLLTIVPAGAGLEV